MEIFGWIYGIGYLLSFIWLIILFTDDGEVDFMDICLSIVLSLFSWITILALWMGSNIKASKDKQGKD